MNRRITGRLAGYDINGNEILDTDVLDPEELAEDYGWVPRRPERPTVTDPATIALLVDLQRAVRR